MTERPITFTSTRTVPGVWKNHETGVEIRKGMGSLYVIMVPARTAVGYRPASAELTLADARASATQHANAYRRVIANAYGDAVAREINIAGRLVESLWVDDLFVDSDGDEAMMVGWHRAAFMAQQRGEYRRALAWCAEIATRFVQVCDAAKADA